MKLILFTAILTLNTTSINTSKVDSFLIKDEDMAIELAKIYWEPAYGKKRIRKSKPIVANISNDSIWVVKGTLPKKYRKGGVPYLEINAYTGEVDNMSMGK